MPEKNEETKLQPIDYLQPTGAGGQMVPPADNALFVPDDVPAPDDRGVNEEDLSTEDDELLNPGESPEFDHTLRRYKQADKD